MPSLPHHIQSFTFTWDLVPNYYSGLFSSIPVHSTLPAYLEILPFSSQSSCCSPCPDSLPSCPDNLSSSHPYPTVAIISSFKVYIPLQPAPGRINCPPEWSHSTLFKPSLPYWLHSSVISARPTVSFCPLDAGLLGPMLLCSLYTLSSSDLIQTYDINSINMQVT